MSIEERKELRKLMIDNGIKMGDVANQAKLSIAMVSNILSTNQSSESKVKDAIKALIKKRK